MSDGDGAAAPWTVADALALALHRGTGGPLFGVLGGGSLAVAYRLVHDHGRDYVAAAREDGAVLMADGLGRAGGGLGLAAITHGPALTNAVTALTEAARARTPLVLLVGDTPPGDRHNPQDIDQAAVVAPTGAGFQPVTSAATAPAEVARALRRARQERRPVVLDVPTPLLDQPAPRELVDAAVARPQPPAPEPAALATAAALLARSERPLVLAGRGATSPEAREAALALADRAGALVATTLLAKGLFAGDAYDLGVCGGYASEVGHDLLGRADCVVALGAGLGPFTADGGALLAGVPVVQVDVDPDAFGRWQEPAVPIHADAAVAARALAADLEGRLSVATWRTPTVAARLAGSGYRGEHPPESAGEAATGVPGPGLDVRQLVRALDELLPERRTVVVDGGHAALSEPSRGLRVPDPDGFVFPLHFGSIGLSLGAAVGAAFARPDRLTTTTIGDGGLLMALSELDTAVRHRLALVVVVMNDGAYGWEYHQMLAEGLDPSLSLIPRPDFAAVARSLGARAVTVSSPAEVQALGPELAGPGGPGGPDGPLLVDARLDREVRTRWFATHT